MFNKGIGTFNNLFNHLPTETEFADLDNLTVTFTKIITDSISFSTPRIKFSTYSKPWWTDELKSLRKKANRFLRIYKACRTENNLITWRDARATYSFSIKQAKEKSWETFLENAKEKDVFTALKLSKGSSNSSKVPDLDYKEGKATDFKSKCDAFLNTIFDQPISTPSTPFPSQEISPAPAETQSPTRSDSKAKWEWPDLSSNEIRQSEIQ